MSYGQNFRLGLSFQNSYGTLNQDSYFWLPALSEGVGIEKPPLVAQGMRGIFDEGDYYEGPTSIPGEIEMEADPVSLGVLLKAVLGPPATVTSDALYTHTFEPRTSDFDKLSAGNPFTLQKYMDDAGSAFLYQDLVGASLELNISAGELLKAKLGIVGGAYSQVVAAAASYPTNKLWTWDQGSSQLGGAAVDQFTQFTVKIEEQLEAMHTLNNSKVPSRVKRTGSRAISIDGTLKFDDQDEYQQFLTQAERELILHFEGSTAVQSGYNEICTIKAPLLRYKEFKPLAGGPGEMEVSISAAGVYSVNSATGLQVILGNAQAAY